MEILKGFKIGRTNAAAFRRSSKTLARVIAVLEALDSKRRPKEERQLLETRELAGRIPVSLSHFHQALSLHPALAAHRVKIPGMVAIFWGSRRSIAELRRRLKHENL